MLHCVGSGPSKKKILVETRERKTNPKKKIPNAKNEKKIKD